MKEPSYKNLEMLFEQDFSRNGFEKLIIFVLYRAYKDAQGSIETCWGLAIAQRNAIKKNGRDFIFCETEIEWGEGNWLDAEDLCYIATGSVAFIKGLQSALDSFTRNENSLNFDKETL